MIARRSLLLAGGGGIAALVLGPRGATSAGTAAAIAMTGDGTGARVRFDPVGVFVEPGGTVTWTNRDPANAHTATAYHPSNLDHPRRIPARAAPFDSDYLLPGEAFTATLAEPGVYDVFCIPHEHAGMVCRIVVGTGAAIDWPDEASADATIAAALRALPDVDRIVAERIVPASA